MSDTSDDKKDFPGCLVGQLVLLGSIFLVIVLVHLCFCAYLPLEEASELLVVVSFHEGF